MRISVEKLKAIVGIAIDKVATDLIKGIAEDSLALKNFSYVYDVLIEKQFISLVVDYSSQEILKAQYFYILNGGEDGAIKISLSNSNNDEVLSIEFEPEYNFDSVIKN